MTERDDAGSTGSMILDLTDEWNKRIECRFEDTSLRLTRVHMDMFFDTPPKHTSLYLRTIFAESGVGEEEATCKDYLQVRAEGSQQVSSTPRYCSLPAVMVTASRRGNS